MWLTYSYIFNLFFHLLLEQPGAVMPLHLLGKKSWNVYNADNIARVKQDEAAAAAREEADEQRMQEIDAERRIQLLRGLKVDPLQPPVEEEEERCEKRVRDGSGRERKRRRIAGENDTDRDIRFAQEEKALVPAKAEMQLKTKKTSDAPITDVKGHINLFPVESSKHRAPKNAEVEAEKAKKQREFEDQYTMRFSNAAGFKQAVGQKPWYYTTGANGQQSDETELPMKDVWGNEDPRRKEREKMRMAADDPLAAIQKGVAGVRNVERERTKWKEEKDREIREMEERGRHRQRKRRRRREEDELDGFSLDKPARDDGSGRHRDRSENESPTNSHHQHRSHHHRHKSVKRDHKPAWEAGPNGRYSSQFAQV